MGVKSLLCSARRMDLLYVSLCWLLTHLIMVHDLANASPEIDTAPLITVDVQTSRKRPTAGTGLGVMADVHNVSQIPVTLNQKHFALVLPPELEGPGSWSFGRYGTFPTEPSPPNDSWLGEITLQPDDTYRIFWTTAFSGSDTTRLERLLGPKSFGMNVCRQIRNELAFLFFAPGEYVITIDAKYWTVPGRPDTTYRTIVQSATLDVQSPQFVILFGAAMGGLIAYFILPRARQKGATSRNFALRGWFGLFGIAGSMFLSSIITILLARISETQFLIKVSVVDLWGGVAVGFVANYAGTRVFDRLLPTEISQDAKRPGIPGDTAKPGPPDGVT